MRAAGRIALFVALTAAAFAVAQPARPGARDGARDGAREGARPATDDRTQARATIERMIDRLETQRARLAGALDRLDAGAPLEEVRGALADGARRDDDAPDPERLMRVFRELNPELHERWRAAAERNPEQAEQFRQRILERLRGDDNVRQMADLMERDPGVFRLRAEQYALDRRAMIAGRRFVDATVASDADAASRARAEVREIVAAQIDSRLREQRLMLERAERGLNASRERIGRAEADRDRVIDERVEELLRRAMAGARDGVPPAGRRGR